MATKKNVSEVPEEETEESYPLVYNLWITTLNITAEAGSTVILQTGRPSDPGKPPGT